jgi:hypothetical protein
MKEDGMDNVSARIMTIQKLKELRNNKEDKENLNGISKNKKIELEDKIDL